MSASLVGSEMCIRDSGLVCLVQAFPRSFFSPAVSRSRPRPRPVARAARAVSYTHLTLPTICSV
eukprot:15056572-Alexandrium_andersonii.AAC.1